MEAPLYEEMFKTEETYWWFRAKRKIVLSLIEQYGPSNKEAKILDVGCGCGYTVKKLMEKYPNAKGLETADGAIEFCSQRGINVIKGTMPDNPGIEPGSIDAVTILDVLEHIEDDYGTLRTIVNFLKPGGILIATVPAHPFLYTKRDKYHQHVRRYTIAEFDKLIDSANMERLLFGYYNFFLFLPIMFSRLLSKALGTDREGPDINRPYPIINEILEGIFASERHLLGRIPFPTGVSLITVLRKPSD